MVSLPSAFEVYVVPSKTTVAPASPAPFARIERVNSSPAAGAVLGATIWTSQTLMTVILFSAVTYPDFSAVTVYTADSTPGSGTVKSA